MITYRSMALVVATVVLNACATTQYEKTVGKWDNSFFENSWIFHRDGALTFERPGGGSENSKNPNYLALVENQNNAKLNEVKYYWKVIEGSNPLRLMLEEIQSGDPTVYAVNFIQDFPEDGKMRICSKNGYNLGFPENFDKCWRILEFSR